MSAPISEEGKNAGGEKKKRAELWEKTIVTSFRDLQWKRKSHECVAPPSNIELGGNIERAFGDSIAVVDERVFLLEMKSTLSHIPDEWVGGEKLALSALRKKLENTNGEVAPLVEMLHLSLRSHHFIYWSEDTSGFGPKYWPGALVISPYVFQITSRRLANSYPDLHDFVSGSTLGIRGENGAQKAVTSAFADRILTDTVALFTSRSLGKNCGNTYVEYSLGISPSEMLRYLEWLLQDQQEKDLPINALLVTASGNVCRHVGHVSEVDVILRALIEGDDQLEIKAQVDVEKDIGWLYEASFLTRDAYERVVKPNGRRDLRS